MPEPVWQDWQDRAGLSPLNILECWWDDWVSQANSEFHPELVPLRSALVEWACQYHLTTSDGPAPWAIYQALKHLDVLMRFYLRAPEGQGFLTWYVRPGPPFIAPWWDPEGPYPDPRLPEGVPHPDDVGSSPYVNRKQYMVDLKVHLLRELERDPKTRHLTNRMKRGIVRQHLPLAETWLNELEGKRSQQGYEVVPEVRREYFVWAVRYQVLGHSEWQLKKEIDEQNRQVAGKEGRDTRWVDPGSIRYGINKVLNLLPLQKRAGKRPGRHRT